MAAKALLVVSHLALSASALIEGGTVHAGQSLRQQRLRLPRARAQAGNSTEGAIAAVDRRSPEDVARLERLLHDLAKKVNAEQKAGKRGEVPPVAESHNEQLDFEAPRAGDPQEVEKLEQIVTDLVKKSGKREQAKDGKATPMKHSVEYIKNLIDNTMLPNRETAHRQDQEALDKAVENLRGCAKSRNRLLRVAAPSKAAYESASSQHDTCRRTEAGESMETQDRCRKTMMEVKVMQAEMTCAKIEEAQRCKYRNYQVIVDAELECERAKKRVREAEALCDVTRSRYDRTKEKCDHIQSMMDEAACKHAVRKKDACEAGDRCYTRVFPMYQATVHRVQKDEMDRRGEWRALKRMQCLMDSFENGVVTDREVDDCKEKTHVPPSIVYPETPANEPCTVPDKYPGTPAYKQAEFGNLPHEAQGKPEAGHCYAMGV